MMGNPKLGEQQPTQNTAMSAARHPLTVKVTHYSGLDRQLRCKDTESSPRRGDMAHIAREYIRMLFRR